VFQNTTRIEPLEGATGAETNAPPDPRAPEPKGAPRDRAGQG